MSPHVSRWIENLPPQCRFFGVGIRRPTVLSILLVAILITQSSSMLRGESPSSDSPKGKLFLFGGAERDANQLLWDEFVKAVGGKGSKVAIFATASSFPERTGNLFSNHMKSLGLEPFIVPAAPMLKNVDVAQVVRDPVWIERVGQADAIFLAGGEQSRYRKTLIDPQNQETPMLSAIRKVYQRGGLIAGTSAGTAIMSRMMFIDAERILPVLVEGARVGKEVDAGLNFLSKDWFVDQHFLTRGRFGRSLVAMQTYDFPYGVGIDEDTALLIEGGSKARVLGYRGVLLMNAKGASRSPDEQRFHWKNVQLSYLSHGDMFDMNTLEIKPGPEKRPEDKVDPNTKDFKPYYLLKQFYNDIFANTQLLDLMYKLVDGPHSEAIGLAFDGDEAKKGDTPGFEFRFYRKGDSVSWDSPIALGDSNTVLNVYLDILPIVIRGPIYGP